MTVSEQPADDRPAITLPSSGDLAFGALMDTLVADEATEGAQTAPAAAAPGAADPAPVVAPGGPDAPSTGAAPAGQPAPGVAPGADAAGTPADQPAGGGTEQPPAVSEPAAPAPTGADPTVVTTQIGGLSTKFEETVTKAYQQEAYEGVKKDYANYFEALEKHPRLLVGTQVPAIGKEGMETLKSSEDAKEWQEAVRTLLVQEIRSKAEVKLETAKPFIDTIHASIDLFKNNPDLIPGTKGFNRTLADAFSAMVTPYEIRDEDDKKLIGYSIPVQPIIEQLRKQQAATPAAPAAPPAAAPAPTSPVEPPQAGITSKAGNSADREDFSTLFGTIGLPNLQI